ncbi:unnamed protein product [Nezara viridula]|uniref:Uncharacterized protein n=1 Tax=Nezara viridula TaxID=85310 RepID=A0A9P0MVL8_NEZVI|nr:unnamed protein product [Nezara viridula]
MRIKKLNKIDGALKSLFENHKMCITLMITSLATTLYIKREWLMKKLQKIWLLFQPGQGHSGLQIKTYEPYDFLKFLLEFKIIK